MVEENKAKFRLLFRSRVELHIHLDGAVRPSTLWDLAKKKCTAVPGKNYEEFYANITVSKPTKNLGEFLEKFKIFMPLLVGDVEAVERIAYEFVEDAYKEGVVYSECRYSPSELANTVEDNPYVKTTKKGDVTPDLVVEAVQKGLDRGYQDFGVKVNQILCCLPPLFPDTDQSAETLRLCKEFQGRGVVGLDMAGCTVHDKPKEDIHIQEAYKCGIHRTVHAGEDSHPEDVWDAVNILHAERVGHGYYCVDDPQILQHVVTQDIHLEACPWSSYLTGSVTRPWHSHPIVRYAEFGANFSISRDDPTIFQKSLDDDYSLVLDKMGLTEAILIRSNFNAARSSFLPSGEKKQLMQTLKKAYGVIDVESVLVEGDGK